MLEQKCFLNKFRVKKIFGSKDILVQKDVGSEKGWGPKNFGTKNC